MRLGVVLGISVLSACRPSGPPHPLDVRIPSLLARDRIPSAVVVFGEGDTVLYRKVFGAARPDTVFDLASLTKVVGTATAALRLVEEGKMGLEDPVGRHLEAFEGRSMTIRDLLSHRTDLPPYARPRGTSREALLHEFAALRTDRRDRYGCLNMIVLGWAAERASGLPLGEFLRKEFWEPLGMKDTGYDPDPSRCAPTSRDPPGRVHDPLARHCRAAGFDPGNAGLFSTGDDLAIYCRALLAGRILKPQTLERAFAPIEDGAKDRRGLGWDLFEDPPYAPGVGHTGYTGTLLWIRPEKKRFLVLLTNRVYPDDTSSVGDLRREVLSVVNR